MAGKKNGNDPQLDALIAQGARQTALLDQLVQLGNAHSGKLEMLDSIDRKLDKLEKLEDIDRTLKDSRQRAYTYYVGLEERIRTIESKLGILSPPVSPPPPID